MNGLSLVVLVGAIFIGADAFHQVVKRLVGGEVAEIGEFPYQVSLRLKGQHYCGGALITKSHVLTAAHCVYLIKQHPNAIKLMTIVAGTNSLTRGGKSFSVKALSYYDNYTGESDAHPADFMYDIGVVTLADEVEESSLIKPIPLPTKQLNDSADAVVTGWGATELPTSPYSDSLRKLNVVVLNNKQCYNSFFGSRQIVDAQLCTFKKHGTGVCTGDSGGPLVSSGELIGIVSGGIACARGFPDIHTRVSSYLDYIHQVIDN